MTQSNSQSPREGSGTKSDRPLVAHFVDRFRVGGVERDVLKLVNQLPEDHYRQAVFSLKDPCPDFQRQIIREDVPVFSLDKQPGHDNKMLWRLGLLLRKLKPTIVHTSNLPTLEVQFVAALAGVPIRVHGLYGRDTYDLEGRTRRYNLLRRALRPLIHRYVSLSQELTDWLITTIGVKPERIEMIPRGVDLNRFDAAANTSRAVLPEGFRAPDCLVIGTIGRMMDVKDHPGLVQAFLRLRRTSPSLATRLRLVIVGEGPLRERCRDMLREEGAGDVAWLPGERGDIPELLGAVDLFVLSSIAEGMPNAILEAMAMGLPVVATRVGAIPELVDERRTGTLVPPLDPSGLAEAMRGMLEDPARMKKYGQRGRLKVEQEYREEMMVARYDELFQELLAAQTRP